MFQAPKFKPVTLSVAQSRRGKKGIIWPRFTYSAQHRRGPEWKDPCVPWLSPPGRADHVTSLEKIREDGKLWRGMATAESAGVWGTEEHIATHGSVCRDTLHPGTSYRKARTGHLRITRNLPERGHQMLGESVNWGALPWSLVKFREIRGDHRTAGLRPQKCQ